MIGEQSAQQRADHGRHPEDRPEHALIAAALAHGNDLADEGGRRHHESTRAEALDRTRTDQHGHRSGHSTEQRSGREDDDAGDEDRAPSEEITELAHDGCGHGGGQQIAGDHPRLVPGISEIGDDSGQGGGDNGAVQRGQEHTEQDRDEDEVAALQADHGARGFLIDGFGFRRLLLRFG